MTHYLKCPNCGFEFTLTIDYDFGECPHCKIGQYYWDYVLDDITYEELFSGYYWETIAT